MMQIFSSKPPTSSGGSVDKNGYLTRITNNDTFNEYMRFSSELKQRGITHLCDILNYKTTEFASYPCLGSRNILSRHLVKEGDKTVEKLALGDYEWMSYTEVKEKSIRFGKGIINIEKVPVKAVAIFAETRAEWLISAMGCFYQRIPVVTLYSTLSNEGIVHALNETEVKILCTSYQILPRVLKLKQKLKFVKTVIVMESNLEDMNDVNRDTGFLHLIKFTDLLITGKGYTEQNGDLDKSEEDIAVIMYTSGSTGIPKGVELSHKNILASVYAYPCTMHITSNDRYLAFLPLAHIMELIAELSCIALKIPILYSSPTTLTSRSIRVMKGCFGDAKVGKPTFTMAVPLVLDRIIKGVQKKVADEGFLRSYIFNIALRVKIWLSNISFICELLDALVFNRVKKELGGQLKTIGVGGSPLADHTHNTMRGIFGCSIRVGYGTTETAACVSGMDWRDNSTGHVGPPNFGVYVRLVSDKERESSSVISTRGEIHAGGDVIAKRYFKREQETWECFYEMDGIRWFITGDIGEKTKEGCLRIIDRKRDYIKLKHGEYVSLLKIETTLKAHMLVENICVIGNPYKENVVAIMTLSEENASMYPHIQKKLCDQKRNKKVLFASSEFKKMIFDELVWYAKQSGLDKWETPAAIYVTNDVWSPDSGHLTASMKLRRENIARIYEGEIKAMFRNSL